jgi:hypothetical protein
METIGAGSDDLDALRRLVAHDVAAGRAARIRERSHAALRARARRFARVSWRALEPLLASGLAALYLLAAFQRAVFLLRG